MESKILLNRKCVNISSMRGCKNGIMKERKTESWEKQTSKIENAWERRILTYNHIHNTFRPEIRRWACYNALAFFFFVTQFMCTLYIERTFNISFQMAADERNKNFRTWFFASSVFILPVSHLWNQSSYTHSLTHFFFVFVRISVTVKYSMSFRCSWKEAEIWSPNSLLPCIPV